MRVRNITTCALALAAALTLSGSLAAQQDTTKLKKTRASDTRIPVTKEAPGEVVPARVDTVTVYRTDTVRTSVTRVDTVTVTPPAPIEIAKIKGPMYWGVFGGTTWPNGNVDRVLTNGFHGGGVLGFESQDSPIGLRLDGTMSQLGKEQGLAVNQTGSGTNLLFELGGDLKVKALNVAGWAFYGVGGVNYYRYKRIATASSNSKGPCDFTLRGECFANANNDHWANSLGFNVGTGVDWHIGSQDMFLEARLLGMQANNARSYFIPISLGVRYF